MAYNRLSVEERHVIEHKATEPPFSGEYNDFYQPGIFICRRCCSPLFSAKAKFDAHCGWPAFDDNFVGAVNMVPDADGQRTEILCAHCHAHLGHVFTGEHFTPKNTHHCVNSLSVKFVAEGTNLPKVLDE